MNKNSSKLQMDEKKQQWYNLFTEFMLDNELVMLIHGLMVISFHFDSSEKIRTFAGF